MNTADLPVHRVDVVESGVKVRRHRVSCEIGNSLKFDVARLKSYCFAEWDKRVFDSFVLAAAVQFCDHTKVRPSDGWGRDIELRIPVHDPTHWESETVSGALRAALELLTGDRWHLEFVQRRNSEPAPAQGNFVLPDGERVVIPYSDGLDSRAVAGLAERKYQRGLIRVRLGSRSFGESRRRTQRVPFAQVPYQVRYGGRGSVETSARSRGFKFALLSGVAAYLCGASRVIVPESGQGALGPALVPVGRTYEDYRSHPLFTNRVETFLSALFDHDIRYIYPRLWNTKAETLADFIRTCPDGENWAQTRSCWQGSRHVSVSGRRRQCGVCAACMLRRMSVHAAGRAERKETYVWENLSAERFEVGAAAGFRRTEPRGAMYEHAVAGALHLDHLSDLLLSQANSISLDRHIIRLSSALSLSERKTREKLGRLLSRHKSEWEGFVQSLGPRSFVARWTSGRS